MELHHTALRDGRLSDILKNEMRVSTGLMNRLTTTDRILVNGTPQRTKFPVRGGDTVTLLLGVRQKLLMALVTALVDAVPLLGTGTILLPWTLVSLLSGEPVRAVGLLGIYVTALITRSALEPKLLGRQLGLDPLAALAALYIGYRIWGFGGMILAPILTVTARELCRSNS